MAITPLPAAPSRLSPTDFSVKADAFVAALPTFVAEANALAAAMNLNDTTSISTTSLAIGTGTQSLTVDASKSYQPGMSVKIARTSSPSNWMHGDVTSYNAGTGALVVNVLDVLGSGTYTDWTVTFSAPMMSGLGYGQTWQTVTRVAGTTYYNTTERPIALSVKAAAALDSQAYLIVSVNGEETGSSTATSATGQAPVAFVSVIIPPGENYSITTSTNTLTCRELR